jgi:hypothetical protein
MRITYATARRDFEKLETIAELEDQVEIDSERLNLMQNPTKKVAMKMYESCISLWFLEHGIVDGTEDIAERNGCV